MTDEEFRAWRQAKIEEIRQTGKTWQWPDTRQHPRWTRDHMIIVAWILLALASLAVIAWGFVR